MPLDPSGGGSTVGQLAGTPPDPSIPGFQQGSLIRYMGIDSVLAPARFYSGTQGGPGGNMQSGPGTIGGPGNMPSLVQQLRNIVGAIPGRRWLPRTPQTSPPPASIIPNRPPGPGGGF
jgi:hypothetical protein